MSTATMPDALIAERLVSIRDDKSLHGIPIRLATFERDAGQVLWTQGVPDTKAQMHAQHALSCEADIQAGVYGDGFRTALRLRDLGEDEYESVLFVACTPATA